MPDSHIGNGGKVGAASRMIYHPLTIAAALLAGAISLAASSLFGLNQRLDTMDARQMEIMRRIDRIEDRHERWRQRQ